MNEYVLGLDTSCYTTSAAACSTDGIVAANCRRLLSVSSGERGLRQSEAVFQHVKQLSQVVEECMSKIPGGKIAAVCASATPRDDPDSCMPVFQVGLNMGKCIASALHVPFYVSTHQRGHIAAAKVDSGIGEGDLLCVHLSGGTSDVLSLKGDSLRIVGGSLDLHAGQMIDRVGVAMGMGFPAGPALEQLAMKGTCRHTLSVSMERGTAYCHISGAETQAQRWIKQGNMNECDIAAEVFDFTGRTVAKMLAVSSCETGIRQGLVAGGVASSQLIRKIIRERMKKIMPAFRVYFGKSEFSGDNAVGIAIIGSEKFRQGEK